MITFVWAQDENGVIGLDGELPWRLPADLKFFKNVTMTGDILMGRVTYDSLPNGALPGRENLIITRNRDFEAEGTEIFHSKEAAMEYAEKNDKPLHVIGGSQIFNMFIHDVDVLYKTVVHAEFDGDTHIPEIDYSEFELVSEEEGPVDEKNIYPHTYLVYKRK